MLYYWRDDHPDTMTFVFDLNWIMTLVLDNPQSFGETAGYHNVTDFCDAYQKCVSFAWHL